MLRDWNCLQKIPRQEAWCYPYGKVSYGIISRAGSSRFHGHFGSMGWVAGMIGVGYWCLVVLNRIDLAILKILAISFISRFIY